MDDLSDIQWIASAQCAEAWERCKGAAAFSKALLAALRLTPWQIQFLQTQLECANGASAKKVADPWNWFWTRILLEQASDQWTADETALDFPAEVAVVDGCCGAGVDSISIARHLLQGGELDGRITSIDSSEVACALTRVNSIRNGVPLNPELKRFEEAKFSALAWLHLDPDRRVAGRTVNVYSTEPSWTVIAERIALAPGASIKAAPGFQPKDDFPWDRCGPPDVRRWISRDGSVRQQRLYWRIPRWENAKRIASAYRRGSGWYHEVFEEEPLSGYQAYDLIDNEISQTGECFFVADHDPALRAAGCVPALSANLRMRVLGNEFGYCTASEPVSNPMLRWYRVLEVMPLDRKKVRAMSRARKVGRWELKSRNVDVDLIQWKKDLVVDKGSDLVRWLLITKLGPKHICMVCEETA